MHRRHGDRADRASVPKLRRTHPQQHYAGVSLVAIRPPQLGKHVPY